MKGFGLYVYVAAIIGVIVVATVVVLDLFDLKNSELLLVGTIVTALTALGNTVLLQHTRREIRNGNGKGKSNEGG